jgi:DNA polymerase-3 subunit epsilon
MGMALPLDGRAAIYPMEIFHAHEPRDLAAAVRFYCGKEHRDSHDVDHDVVATTEILDACWSGTRTCRGV